jgi:hypothetical protein
LRKLRKPKEKMKGKLMNVTDSQNSRHSKPSKEKGMIITTSKELRKSNKKQPKRNNKQLRQE